MALTESCFGWCIYLSDATFEGELQDCYELRHLLNALHWTLVEIPGIVDVRWFKREMFHHQLDASEQAEGITSPFET